MKQIQSDFIQEIGEVENHLNFIEKLKDDILQGSTNLDYYKSPSRKRFEYNSVIISLYGMVEKYTEKIIKKYIEELEYIFIEYAEVNPKIRERHFELSIQLLSKVMDGRFKKYESLRKEDIVQKLNDCTNKSGQFLFNKDAFILNSGNIHHVKICEYFRNLDIDIDLEIRKCKEFSLKTENLFNKLEELVQRRNEIAHGSSSDILNFSEITPFIEFLKKYFCSIITILRDNINDLSYNYKLSNFGTKLENFHLYSSTLIGLRDGARWELAIGDEIFIKKADGEISYSKIEEIRTYEATSDISIKINGNVKKNSLIYKYNKKDYIVKKRIV